MKDPIIGLKASALLHGCIEDASAEKMSFNQVIEIERSTGKGYLFIVPLRYDDAAITAMVHDAISDETAWVAVNSLSELIINRGDAIPAPLRGWIVERMRGNAKCSARKRPGPSRWRDFERNFRVCMEIAKAIDTGQTTTAATEIAAANHGLTIVNAEQIWKRRPPSFRE